MLLIYNALRCRSSGSTPAMASEIIHEYLKQRNAKKSEQVKQLKAQHEHDEKCKLIDSKAIEGNHRFEDAPPNPEVSQKTLYNYFDTRPGRMLRSCISLKKASSVDYDVFYSVSGLQAKADKKEAYTKRELQKFKRIDPRLPLSGLNIFMWGIQKTDIIRRYHVWQMLSEDDKMIYRKKAQELGAEIEYFPLPRMKKKYGKQEAVQRFRIFVKENWAEAEKMAESPLSGFRNSVFSREVKKCLITLHLKPFQDQREVKVHDIPKMGFDIFASEKGIKAVEKVQGSVQQKQHNDLWKEWCGLDDQQRKSYITEASLQNTLPYFRPSQKEIHLDVKFDETLTCQKAKWYHFVCQNFATANEASDRKARVTYARNQANILRPVKSFTYTEAQRCSSWYLIKKQLSTVFREERKQRS